MENHSKTCLTNIKIKSILVLSFAIIVGFIEHISVSKDNNYKKYNNELSKVLSHYKDQPLKYEAAKFLIENMAHSYPLNEIMEDYKSAIMMHPKTKGFQDSVWLDISKQNNPLLYRYKQIKDADIITSEYLINNIDEAFNSWETSIWYDLISFTEFCNYILPYRVKNEPLSNWRKILRNKYLEYIRDITNPEEAFVVVYNKILLEFKKGHNLYPYSMDVLMIDKIMKGTCEDRSLYITSVLRALGIPAAFDYIPYWANFTTSGHSWVSFIRNDSTFTLMDESKKVCSSGHIDASRFYQKKFNYSINDLPYNVDSIKKVGKVFRATYEIQLDRFNLIKNTQNKIPEFFNNLFLKDVSSQYYLQASKEIITNLKEPIYLCNFVASKNWQPIQVSHAVNNKVSFYNLNKEVVYLPAYYSKGNFIPISFPFYITKEDSVHEFIPDKINKEKIHIKRKHILTFHWTDRWSEFLGGRFEGSDFPDFLTKDVLYEIQILPSGIEYIGFIPQKRYRYIRFISQEDNVPNFSEFVFLGKGSLADTQTEILSGKMIYKNIDVISLSRGMDKDYSTFFRMTNTPGIPQKGYWFGYDLGVNNKFFFTNVEFCPISDQNMIEPGDYYELFYFDNKWITLGEQIATSNKLSYNNVPTNSLLWLKNKTKGKEERIFTYSNNRQVWW